MKQQWADEELLEAWQIWPAEQHMIEKKRGVTRLVFALFLKFFQIDGRFPSGAFEIPAQAVRFVAAQVGVEATELYDYSWEGRALKYHRAEIREWCGFREVRATDMEGFKRWLVEEANWNSANDFILIGKKGEITTNKQNDMEMSLLCLHLIQASLVYVNTLMIQEVLEDPQMLELMTPRDLGALSPLLTSHVTPFGRFDLDMTTRLPLKASNA